jgi:tRNA G10  N-methylase Trm11
MLSQELRSRLFQSDLELLPQMNEIYELELAFLESQELSADELIRRGAYVAKVNGCFTHHYRMCSGDALYLPAETSAKRRKFFEKNLFRTGYSTHGLFPYRGKFHPQMVKGILNAMGVRHGETVLDPMMGSGTTVIEAALIGVHAIGVDASPFCRFMAAAKVAGFFAPIGPLENAASDSERLLTCLREVSSQLRTLAPSSTDYRPSTWPDIIEAGWIDPAVWPVLLLAFFDAVGFAERSSRNTPEQQFKGIVERYAFVVKKARAAIDALALDLGEIRLLEGDARQLPLQSDSVDAILFSPPYSFAVDYVENDETHLRMLGVDLHELRERMVGLRGRTARQKLDHYLSDMSRVLAECARVLKPGRFCTVVIGTNNQQIARVLGKAPEEVEGLDELVVSLAEPSGLRLARRLPRKIVGMSNTMRNEDILMLAKQ